MQLVYHIVFLYNCISLLSYSNEYKTFARAFKHSPELNADSIRLKFFVFIQRCKTMI